MKEIKEITKILTEEELKELKEKGYTPVHYIGSGHTRDVFEALYENQGLKKIRVLKIPKKKMERNICTLINLSRFPEGNPNIDELACSSEIGDHPNIARIIDVVGINGRVATIEEYVNGDSLEELVNKGGPLGRKQFKKIFEQIIRAVYHLHKPWEPVIHRDIKPSNILINKKGIAKLTDLQTAKRKSKIEEKIMPTRGGTAYTSPDLLNALFNGNKNKADEKTDVYALGAMMYFTLTGKVPFNYKIIEDEEGNEIKVKEEALKISLLDDRKKVKEITKEQHEKNLKKALRKVPRAYRKMLKKCLALDDKKYGVGSLESDLERTDKTQSFKNFIKKHKKAIFWGSLSFSLYGILAVMNRNTRVKDYDHNPTLYELLDNKRYVNMLDADPYTSTASMWIETPTEVLNNLKPHVKEIREKINDKDIKEILEYSKYAKRSGRRSDEFRELDALLLSCYLSNKDSYKNKRSKNFLVPLNFARGHLDEEDIKEWTTPGFQEAGFALHYLTMCEQPGDRIEDLFVKYFCSREEIFEARRQANSLSYFTIFDKEKKYMDGYREFLDKGKRKLIDKAIAIYLAMDEKGNLREIGPLKD